MKKSVKKRAMMDEKRDEKGEMMEERREMMEEKREMKNANKERLINEPVSSTELEQTEREALGNDY